MNVCNENARQRANVARDEFRSKLGIQLGPTYRWPFLLKLRVLCVTLKRITEYTPNR